MAFNQKILLFASYLRTLLFAFFIVISPDLFGQPGGHGNPCPKPPCPPPVPISGIEYLIGLGGLYGVRKMMNRAKVK